MTFSIPFRPNQSSKSSKARDSVREEWLAERLRDARMVVADVAHHSDLSLRIAAQVLKQHGDSEEEREDARILLVILDAKSPFRDSKAPSDPAGRS